MAAARAARDAKRSSTHAQLQLQQQLEAEEARRVREERRNEARKQVSAATVDGELQESLVPRTPTRWYMGQYGNNEGTKIHRCCHFVYMEMQSILGFRRRQRDSVLCVCG